MITIIAAASENNILGKDNDLIWHLPKDFKRFKELTSGHFIIMGRKTFESFPKPLPNRTHIIITRDISYSDSLPESCFAFKSIEEGLRFCENQENIFIIGGGEIYKQMMDISDKIELTRVHTDVEGDTLFPEIDNKWELVEEVKIEKDEKHLYDFTYLTYIKK